MLNKILISFSLFFCAHSFAGTVGIQMDLDTEETKFVIADMVKNVIYLIDKTACICGLNWGLNNISVVDCKKLKAYPKLAPHVEQCK
jgi:hypothetical protein